jgi:hypothetical protein
LRQIKSEDSDSVPIRAGVGFVHIKTKDNVKDIVCHMIGLMGLLNRSFKAHFISKFLKKELSDLKNYFQELGFNYEDMKDEQGRPDILVRRPRTQDSL